MDRGIDWDHPDFVNPDGTTRIKWLYDMSPEHPAPVEFSAAQINAAYTAAGRSTPETPSGTER